MGVNLRNGQTYRNPAGYKRAETVVGFAFAPKQSSVYFLDFHNKHGYIIFIILFKKLKIFPPCVLL